MFISTRAHYMYFIYCVRSVKAVRRTVAFLGAAASCAFMHRFALIHINATAPNNRS